MVPLWKGHDIFVMWLGLRRGQRSRTVPAAENRNWRSSGTEGPIDSDAGFRFGAPNKPKTLNFFRNEVLLELAILVAAGDDGLLRGVSWER